MSWDIFIQDLPDVRSAKEIPDDFRPGTIGDREELVKRIQEAVPLAERQDKDWLFVRTPDVDLSIEVRANENGVTDYIVLHVHGGAGSPACVASIVAHLGLRALDTGTSEFFDPQQAVRSFEEWSRFRDRTVSEG